MSDWTSSLGKTPAGDPPGTPPPLGSAPPPLGGAPFGGEVKPCVECGKMFFAQDMIRHGNVYVCANCKPVFMQKLSEGARVDGSTFRYAGFWIRFAAMFIDGLIMGVVGGVMGLIFGVGLFATLGNS